MVKYTLVVAALLLTTGAAQAAESPEHQSKNVRKALIILGHLGADSKEIRSFVENIDSRIEKDVVSEVEYLTIAKERVETGTVRLHYRLGEGLKLKNVELRYTPDNSNWTATARPDSVMLNYSYRF